MSVLAPWQQRVHDQLQAALLAGRLGHGLLFTGPAGIGKAEVARRLARQLLTQGGGAAAARSAQLLDAGTHPDLMEVSFIANKAGDKLRTEIVIEQVRRISQQLALTPQYGIAQVVIVDPADAINSAAANALLKTLEEPSPGRFLWLLSSEPARLPATIRSRCQRVEFRLPGHEEALAWLQQRGHAPALAEQALEAARGHPGLADQWLAGDGWALRSQVAEELSALAAGRVAASELAARWSADAHAAVRLRHAAELAQQQAATLGLTDPVRLHKLAAWYDAANNTRRLLGTTVRADLAMVELLMGWAAVASTASKGTKE